MHCSAVNKESSYRLLTLCVESRKPEEKVEHILPSVSDPLNSPLNIKHLSKL